MNKEEFIKNAMEILQECGLTKEQSDVIANATIQLEKSKIKQLIDDNA